MKLHAMTHAVLAQPIHAVPPIHTCARAASLSVRVPPDWQYPARREPRSYDMASLQGAHSSCLSPNTEKMIEGFSTLRPTMPPAALVRVPHYSRSFPGSVILSLRLSCEFMQAVTRRYHQGASIRVWCERPRKYSVRCGALLRRDSATEVAAAPAHRFYVYDFSLIVHDFAVDT